MTTALSHSCSSQGVDHAAVEYSSLYDKIQALVAEEDMVRWILPEDKLVFHRQQEDIQDMSRVVTAAEDHWWPAARASPSIGTTTTTDSREHFTFPVPMQPNNTLFFMDWVYQYTGYDVNENDTLLYWQSRLTYFSPIYHLLYPFFILLISFLSYIMLQGGTLSIWQYIALLFYQFCTALRSGFVQACSALFRPGMYFYGLYESWKSRHIHHKALSETTDYMKRLLQSWSDRFSAVQRFCQHARHCVDVHRENGYLQRTVFSAFHKVESYFTTLLAEYAYLTDARTSDAELYANVGKTLVLRWQLTFSEKDRAASSCQAAVRVLDAVSSKVAVVRLWNLLFRERRLVSPVTWTEAEDKERMVQSRYPFLLCEREGEPAPAIAVVGNDCLFGDSNAVVTGPNATGKTTYLKSVILNFMLVHHCGVGFFDSCLLHRPFEHFVCYINVPDTSDRDSLFQAEASQSLQMIKVAQEADRAGKRTFAIFDELFTGTNPEDASKLTKALLRYLAKIKNLRFLCTTHFTAAVSEMQEEDRLTEAEAEAEEQEEETRLCYLQTEFDAQTGKKTFHLLPGVSRASNVLKVLADLGYPSFILDRL